MNETSAGRAISNPASKTGRESGNRHEKTDGSGRWPGACDAGIEHGFVGEGTNLCRRKNLVPQLGILGVEIDREIASMIEDLRDPYGIIVARAAGAATEIPLTTGDVIRALNGEPVNTLDKLRASLKALAPGAPVVLQVQRDGRLQFVTFAVESRSLRRFAGSARAAKPRVIR